MNLPRRAVIGLVALLVAVGAGLALLIPRFGATLDSPANDGATDTRSPSAVDENPLPRTSEELIAAALKAGHLTYEESLLERAYALYDDPRLAPAFRSPVANWEAGLPLFLEVARNEARLSPELLAALEPFRARPNDPNSIFNRPREDVVKVQAQGNRGAGWVSAAVPYTNLRVWIKGTQPDLAPYIAMTRAVWTKLPAFFPLPNIPDVAGDPDNTINPDNAIDIYVMAVETIDPRELRHRLDLSTRGMIWPTKPTGSTTSSAFVMIQAGLGTAQTVNTMAHELSHVSQLGIDTAEAVDDGTWLVESTGSWIGYKVAKALGHTPTGSYNLLDPDWTPPPPATNSLPLFNRLGNTLNSFYHRNQAWLIYQSASMDLGDDIAKSIWRNAAAPGQQGIEAMEDAMPFDVSFPRFAVRNWHQDFEPGTFLYESKDKTFPSHLKPDPIITIPFVGRETAVLDVAVPPLSAKYYRFRFGATVRRVTFQTQIKDIPYAHVWAIRKLGADWKEPEDWSRDDQHIFCRDDMKQDLSELVIVVSNSHINDRLPPHPTPRLLAEEIGCDFVDGWATSRLRLKDETQDMTYVSSRVPLSFKPRSIQDQTGNVQFDLMATSVTWTASGTKGDCTVEGRAIVNIQEYLDEPLDPTRTAWGYMNVVGQDGGDFHSIRILAADSGLTMKKTCPSHRPGYPPIVTIEPMGTGHLLTVLSQPNTHIGNAVLFRGTQNFDPARLQNNLPMSPDSALSGLLNSPVRGFITPEIQRQLKEAQAKLDQVAAESGGRMVYAFEWELQPRSGTPQVK